MSAAAHPRPVDEELDAEATLVSIMAEMNALEGQERYGALLQWARSEWWSPILMMCEGDQGKMAREAWRTLKAELDADTPARRWAKSDIGAGRASIKRLLCPEAASGADYACLPFRIYWTQEDEPWIAGAVGCPPVFDLERLKRWEHLDISDVILWNPKSNAVQLAGDAGRSLIQPYCPDGAIQVYDHDGRFFRAWAANRLATWALGQKKQRGEWLHPVTEPRDGGLPGVLAIGGIERQQWSSLCAEKLIAPVGADPRVLRRAVIASANLPRIEEAARANG